MLPRFLLLALVALSLPALADTRLAETQARFEVEVFPDGSRTVYLLAGGPLGLGGVAFGRVESASAEPAIWLAGTEEVSGVQPTPFFPVGQGDVSGIDPTPFAPSGARVVGFSFDRTGAFSGIQPTPFRIFLVTPRGVRGELVFADATAALGSLRIGGVVLEGDPDREVIAGFVVTDLIATAPALPALGWAWLALLVAGVGGLALRRPVDG